MSTANTRRDLRHATDRATGRTAATATDTGNIDSFREGWRAHLRECLAVLEEGGPEALAESVRRKAGERG